jgi:SAM-dependent methyltransferase
MLNLEQQNRHREAYRKLNPEWRPATETYAALANSYLDRTSRVLDLGCGRGGLIEQLEHPPALITGADPDLHSLREHRLKAISRVVTGGVSLPFRPRSFDLILASWLFEHLPRPADTLREVRRVLKPGGAIIFITPNGHHPLSYLNRLLGRLEGSQGMMVKKIYGRERADTFPTYYRANTPEHLSRLSRQAGLEQIVLTAVPDPTYLAFNDGLFRLASMFEENLPQSRYIHLVGLLRRTG